MKIVIILTWWGGDRGPNLRETRGESLFVSLPRGHYSLSSNFLAWKAPWVTWRSFHLTVKKGSIYFASEWAVAPFPPTKQRIAPGNLKMQFAMHHTTRIMCDSQNSARRIFELLNNFCGWCLQSFWSFRSPDFPDVQKYRDYLTFELLEEVWAAKVNTIFWRASVQ